VSSWKQKHVWLWRSGGNQEREVSITVVQGWDEHVYCRRKGEKGVLAQIPDLGKDGPEKPVGMVS